MAISPKQEWNRRVFLKKTLLGAGSLAIPPLLARCNTPSHLQAKKRGMAAEAIPFNTGWLFGGLYKPGSPEPGYADTDFQKITLPHSVTPLSWCKWDPGSWQREWIYRRHFSLSKAQWKGRRVLLEIGAAMTEATLLLNGQQVGKHTGGYLPLHYELTDHLMEGDNVLAVRLNARFDINVPPDKPGKDPRSVDFWQPGGIYRNARLLFVPEVFIKDVFVRPVNVLEPDRKFLVNCTLEPAVVPGGKTALKLALMDGQREIATVEKPVTISGAETQVVDISWSDAAFKALQLWDVEHPRLYRVVATLLTDGRPVHEYAVRTGLREAKFTKEGFYLNGRRLQLIGLNRHQFYPYMGAAVADRVQAKDVAILRTDLNCNMVRCSHYPQSEAFFDACDELGLLAWEEAPGWGSPLGDEQWKQRAVTAVEEMIKRDRNHPSIVIWGARLNETPDDVELYTRTRDLAHSLDPSRQTTGAMVGGKHDTRNFVQDVFSYNDYARSKAADGRFQPELLPPRTDRPYLVSEAVGTLSGPAKYYRRTDSAAIQQSQAWAHGRVHDIAASDKRYCGLLAWSGFDYPSGSGNQFEGTKYTGVIDLFREPKPGAAIYQAQADPAKKPVIAPAFYWGFGPQSLPLPAQQKAMICSNCEKLEVFVDGTHYATLYPDKKQFPHLAYPPSFVDFRDVNASKLPELRIDGYAGSREVVSHAYSSDTSKDRLWVHADDDQLNADGSDTTRVVFRVTDHYGMPRPHGKGKVSFTLTGPATMYGDNPFDLGKTGGVGALWIRSLPGQRGKIKLQVTHDRYEGRIITLAAV